MSAVRAARLAAYALPAAPLAVTAYMMATRAPGLQQRAGDVLGLDATLCLLACLAVTPAATLTGMRNAARYRQWLGQWVFIPGAAGLVLAAWSGGIQGFAGTVQIWTGTLIMALLTPLTLTSSQAAQRMLGSYWKKWQRRLTWAAWGVLAVHLMLLSPAVAAAYLVASVPLLAARVPGARRQMTRFRRSRMTNPQFMQACVPAGTFLYVFGMTILAYLEGAACATAV